jgi:hypothetical protein
VPGLRDFSFYFSLVGQKPPTAEVGSQDTDPVFCLPPSLAQDGSLGHGEGIVGGELSGIDRDRGLLLRFGSVLVLRGRELLLPRLDAGRPPGYLLPDVSIGVGVAFRFDEGLVVRILEGLTRGIHNAQLCLSQR